MEKKYIKSYIYYFQLNACQLQLARIFSNILCKFVALMTFNYENSYYQRAQP